VIAKAIVLSLTLGYMFRGERSILVTRG
jgi:hypothetical protein